MSVNININSQPAWGPVGHDYARFYYFPAINSYYDVNNGVFIYFNSGRWVSARYLPYRYRHFDLYGTYKVVLNTRDPWLSNSYHIRDYSRYKGHHKQIVIRDSRDYRYNNSRQNNVVWYNEVNNSRPNRNNNSRPVADNNVRRPANRR